MKVANTKPSTVKSPVRITDTKYAMWYARPVNLGEITKQGIYWYTSDGMRFASSRNALDYLAKIRELVEIELALEAKYQEKINTRADTPVQAQQKRGVGNGAVAARITTNSASNKGKKNAPNNFSGVTFDRESFDKFVQSLGYTRKQDKNNKDAQQ